LGAEEDELSSAGGDEDEPAGGAGEDEFAGGGGGAVVEDEVADGPGGWPLGGCKYSASAPAAAAEVPVILNNKAIINKTGVTTAHPQCNSPTMVPETPVIAAKTTRK
jgi:hypothetical protein